MQYQLMRYIAIDHDHVTIVGDPDQSSACYFPLLLPSLSRGQYMVGDPRIFETLRTCKTVSHFPPTDGLLT
jgi:hypothetical protein